MVSKYLYGKLNKTIFHGKQETHLISNKPGRAVTETRNGWRTRGQLTEQALWLRPARPWKDMGTKAKAVNPYFPLVKRVSYRAT